MRRCLDCEKEAIEWYCMEHYLLKEARYGCYDLLTNNVGFRRGAVRRIFNYLKYKYL